MGGASGSKTNETLDITFDELWDPWTVEYTFLETGHIASVKCTKGHQENIDMVERLNRALGASTLGTIMLKSKVYSHLLENLWAFEQRSVRDAEVGKRHSGGDNAGGGKPAGRAAVQK